MDRPHGAPGRQTPHHLAARRTASGAVVGIGAAAVTARLLPWQATALVAWSTAGLVYLVRVWVQLLRHDPPATAAHARREDDSRVAADLTLLASSVASLVAVGLMLVKSAEKGSSNQALFTSLSVVSVVVSWAVVHTVFALAYGRLHYGDERGGIGFPGDHDPSYRDFAYVAFTVGMTYQVSDTELRGPAVRGTALRHALLSYLFGTAVIAVTINVVAGLAR